MAEISENMLDSYLKEFEKDCDKSLDIYCKAISINNEQPEMFPEAMRNMLVEYIILKNFGQWERFLENIFIEYMLGAKSEKGVSLTRYVNPKDKEHAYRMIQNVNQYPDWSDVEKILKNAENFFEKGGAFEILKTMKAELTSLKKVRNSIAHISLRAKKDFENLVQGKIGYLPDDITPSKFLIEYKVEKKKSSPTYCEHYILYLKNLAKMIVEYNGEEQ